MKKSSERVSFPKMSEDILAFWESRQIFKKSNQARCDDSNKPLKEFSFYDGPPFANGLPHYGHMLGQTLKDIVPRYWNMRGYYVERRFGWDCHGLPVEVEVEKKLNLQGRKDILQLGVDKFNETCRETVFHYASEWQKTVKKIGRWVDWDNQYRTMDLSFMESVWWVLGQLHGQGLLYRDKKIVAYSPKITAVLSNFEANLNYKDVQDPSLTVKFKLAGVNEYFLAWTTTPWTLISNLALAVNPELEYLKVKHNPTGEIYYFAEARKEFVFAKNSDDFECLENIPGSSLVSKTYEPLFPHFKDQPQSFKVLAAAFVSTEAGTGIVHCAPAFGEDDFQLCKQNGIDAVDPLDDEARFTDIVPEYEGQFVKEADKAIIKDLKNSNIVFRHETIVHSYPHCDRSNGPLIYRAIPTWYIAVEKIRDKLSKNNQQINWVPDHLREGRMGQWLANARDWAISRNRFWGTPIPIWVSDNDPNHFEVLTSVSELEQKVGKKLDDIHKHKIDHLTWKCEKTGATMRRVPEVFDCWFESGSMPYAQKHFPFENKDAFERSFPADFIAEGQDQTRGWFYTLLVLAGALFDKPAFKNVIVNGIILAEDGKKMSKRLKNYTPPDELIDTYGADAVRLYMINSAVLRGDDLKFSDVGVKDTVRAVMLPLWNSYSFLETYANAENWQPSAELLDAEFQPKHEMDRWLFARLQSLKKMVHTHMEKYHLYLVVPEILQFIDELTNWYIRLNRRRFWGESAGANNDDTTQAFSTLYCVMVEFTRIFAPFAPFISEKIYLNLIEGMQEAKESVHLCDIPMVDEKWLDADLEEQMQLTQKVAFLGRSIRAAHKLKTRQVLPSLTVVTRSEKHKSLIATMESVIKEELNVKEVYYSTDEARYVELSLKPNLKKLGPKLGSKLREFRSELDKLNSTPESVAEFVANLESKASSSVLLGSFSVGVDDFLIERSAKGSQTDTYLATDSGVSVILDAKLTPELIREGMAREIVNRIQKQRKDADLQVSDRIHINYEADADLKAVFDEHREYICAETLATKLDIGISTDNKSQLQASYEFDNKQTCKIAIHRA